MREHQFTTILYEQLIYGPGCLEFAGSGSGPGITDSKTTEERSIDDF